MNKIKRHSHLEQIAGDYQYKALRNGNIIQRQWHRNRHNLLYFLNFLSPKDVVLDVGCGSGNVLFEFSSKVKSFTGIDNNPECIDFIKKQMKKLKIKNAGTRQMDILKITLKQKYSKVIMTEVIEHFDRKDTKQLLREIRKVMRKGGKLLITTPNYHSGWTFLEKLIDIFHLTPSLWGEQHLIKFTPKILNEVIESQGFTIEQSGTLNFISPFITLVSRKLADFVSRLEFKYFPFGNLLYVVAVKK